MELKETIEELEKTKEFKEWKKEHPQYYLAHGFMMPEESTEWQVGYTDGDKITTFFVYPIQILPEQECYKEPGDKVKKLDKDELKLSLEKAKEIFDKTKKEKYRAETILKTIIIVQNNGKNIYNITGLAMSMKTLNVKIDMEGKVISDSLFSIMDQVKGEAGK